MLQKPWAAPGLIKPPKVTRLPDIVTVETIQRIIQSTRVLSYRVFFFTLYSLGLRLGEGLRLQVGDIDAAHERAHLTTQTKHHAITRINESMGTDVKDTDWLWQSVSSDCCQECPDTLGNVE